MISHLSFCRPSSPYLAKAVNDGINVMQGKAIDYGLVSTPQLHFFVTCQNTDRSYGEPNEEGYYMKLATAFKALRGEEYENGSYKPFSLRMDGANGVGALKMKSLQRYLGDCFSVTICNDGSGKLNYQCGADYVKVQQKPPQVIFNISENVSSLI